VATRAVCHFDNAYYLSDVDIRAGCGKTNTQSNTAFRGFGGPQGRLRLSTSSTRSRAISGAMRWISAANFYGKTERNVTPYGQEIVDNVIDALTAELEQTSEYRARRKAIEAFNAPARC
jgi:xanthine dehydrogenase large subunit